jgi:hypothetical protein
MKKILLPMMTVLLLCLTVTSKGQTTPFNPDEGYITLDDTNPYLHYWAQPGYHSGTIPNAWAWNSDLWYLTVATSGIPMVEIEWEDEAPTADVYELWIDGELVGTNPASGTGSWTGWLSKGVQEIEIVWIFYKTDEAPIGGGSYYDITFEVLYQTDAWITGGGQILAENQDPDNEKKNGKYEDYKISFGMGAYRIIDEPYLLDSCEVTFHNVSNNDIDKYKFVGETIHEMNFYYIDGSVANCRISGTLYNDEGDVVDGSCYMWIRLQDSGEPAWEDNIRFQLLNAGTYNYDSSSSGDFPNESINVGTHRTTTATGNLQVEDLTM